jgi:hypothetical protein
MAEKKTEKDTDINIYDESRYTSGKFYRMYFNGSANLKFMNSGLRDMIGYSREEIHEKFGGRYIELIHPNDRHIYAEFLEKMASEERSLTVQYRIITKRGDLVRVSDTMTSQKRDDEGIWGFSVLTAAEDASADSSTIMDISDAVPCGIVRLTYEQYPSVLAVNSGMEDLLGVGCGKNNAFEDMKENIFFMIPFEYRQAFRDALNKAGKSENGVNLKMEIFRCDGSRVHVAAWLYKVKEGLRTVYQGVFMKSGVYLADPQQTLQRDFFNALTYVHDAVYELNIAENTVNCLCTEYPDVQNNIPGVRMFADDIAEYWCKRIPVPAQQKKFMDFFREALNNGFNDATPHSIDFSIDCSEFSSEQAENNSDKIRYYTGTFFKINEVLGVFCCLDMTSQKRKMAEEMACSNIMEFRLKDNIIMPLNVTAETQRFTGLSSEEITEAIENGADIDEFFSHCPLSSEEVRSIINGQLNAMKEYTVAYGDGRIEKRYACMVACGVDAADTYIHYAFRYNIVIPEKRNVQRKAGALKNNAAEDRKIVIRTFGYFDVFVDGRAVLFKSSKAKELLAVLVDRRGGYVSAREAINCIWEDEDSNKVTLARYRKVVMRLKQELEDNNIPDLVIHDKGKRCINLDIVKCDLYDYLSDKEKNRGLFNGVYMQNYSWSEFTLPELGSFSTIA